MDHNITIKKIKISSFEIFKKNFVNLQNFAFKSDLVQISEPHGPVLDPEFWQSGTWREVMKVKHTKTWIRCTVLSQIFCEHKRNE